MNIVKILPVLCLLTLTGCVGVSVGLNTGLNAPGGQLRPSPQNHAVMMSIRCPYGSTPVSDTGVVAGFLDEQVDRRTNWRPNRNWGRGDNRNRSPYGLGSVRRDSAQEFTRTLTCSGERSLLERTLGVEVRRQTDSFRGGNWDERTFDTGWRKIR